jgi:hypothetical protein
MPSRKRSQPRTVVFGENWKRPITIASDKYAAVARAIVSSLTAEPVRFSELLARIEPKLAGFDGSVAWYAISVARNLEAEGKLVRQSKPVLYSRPGGRRGARRHPR